MSITYYYYYYCILNSAGQETEAGLSEVYDKPGQHSKFQKYTVW